MGCSPLQGHACTPPSFDQDVLLDVVLDVLDLDVGVRVVPKAQWRRAKKSNYKDGRQKQEETLTD